MAVSSICTRRVITVDIGIDIVAAAAVMRESKIGYLIVTDKKHHGRGPAGVITDRDIAIKVTALDIDPNSFTVGDVMTRDPLTAADYDSISDTLRRMRSLGVRRVPVVGDNGQITGVLSIDDVVDHLATQLTDLAGSARSEPQAKHRSTA